MRLFLFVAIAAALAAGCAKQEDASTDTTKPSTGSPPPPSTGTNAGKDVAVSTGKYAAIQAIFTTNCVKCHSGPRPKAGIDLTSYTGVMKGGREGPVIVPGDPSGSKLVKALHGKGAKQMPPPGALPADQITKVEAWIKAGAKAD